VLQAQVNRVLSKAGIHFSGEFKSQFLNSQVSGNAIDSANKRSESAEYTSVDFDIVARPNSSLGARAVFRLHQDWRNFFSDVQNPIVTRWLSIDGQVGGMLEYHAGDYLKKISPLTLWNHEFEVFYEPEIFAADRKFAMSEAFVGDSKRLLQGFDIAFKAELFPILKEVGANVFGARLATRGTKESMVVSNPAIFDKYLLGFDIGSQIIEGAGFAVSDIYIYDNLASYGGSEDMAKGVDPQATNVIAGRLNADTRTFMDDGTILAGINIEAAYSSDNHWQRDADAPTLTYKDTAITGMAINAGLSLRVALNEENSIKLTADYVMNDVDFRNDAAQTPYFTQRQIMNSENGISGLGELNPFDAMYRAVFKYVPPMYPGSGQPFAAQPQTKNAYNNVILSPGASATYNPGIFQVAGNKATANRTGPVVKLDGSFLDEALTVGARVTMFNATEELALGYNAGRDPVSGDQIEGTIPITPEFLTAGGGASVDIAKFVPVLGPSLKIGGSFMMYNSTTADTVASGSLVNVVKSNSESQLISAELVYNFAPRFSILAGYQLLNTTIKSEINGAADPAAAPDQKYKFDNLGIGFGYKVADGGNLTVKLTMLSGEGPVGGETKSYTAMQPEVFLTVKF